MKILKIIIDILLLIVTFLLVNVDITGRLLHEILGISISILLIIHIFTNWKWIKSVTKNFKKVNKKNKMMYIVCIITMVAYFGAIIFGIIVSDEIFKFKTSSNFKFILIHIIFGKIAVITMLLHLGLNLDIIFVKIKNKKIKAILKLIYIIFAIIISIYLIYTLTHSFQWMSVFGMTMKYI